MSEPHGMLARAVERLHGHPDEALGVMRQRRWLPRKLVPAGRAWRLGVLLLDRDGRLYETGAVTRAVEPQRGVASKSPDAELRREDRRAAVRGRFAEGETVNFGFAPIDLSALPSGPLSVVDDVVMVRWNARGEVRPLEGYLDERIGLLLEGD